MFEILILISIIGVVSALNNILSDYTDRKEAKENLKRFEEEHPSNGSQTRLY